MYKTILAFLTLSHPFCFSQDNIEVQTPFNIKTVTFTQNNQNIPPILQFGDSFTFEFDDLFGTETNYYYQIDLYDYDWKPTELSKNEYLLGFDNQRIVEYSNSFNTLQLYSHYKVSFPNQFTTLKKSGNYIIKILNEEKEIVFFEKFILFENIANIPIQIRRARKSEDLNTKHNLDFSIKSNNILFQDPIKNVKVLLLQNGQLNTAIKDIKPQYTIGNDLIYRYDSETQFWAGNEFLNFDTKDIRVPANMISYVTSIGGVYNSHLFTNRGRALNPYTFFPDINGNFVTRCLNSENDKIEADYSWVFFSLLPTIDLKNKDIYINGLFNNFALTDQNKMNFNPKNGLYEKAIMIKQGFNNFQYITTDKNGKIEPNFAVDGNFYQTENNYSVLVYYRANGQRYDRVIGKGDATSIDIIN